MWPLAIEDQGPKMQMSYDALYQDQHRGFLLDPGKPGYDLWVYTLHICPSVRLTWCVNLTGSVMPLAIFKSIEPCGSPLSNKQKAEKLTKHTPKRQLPLWIFAEEYWKRHNWYLSNKTFQHRFEGLLSHQCFIQPQFCNIGFDFE